MGKKYKESKLYRETYPNYLSWNKAIWITKVNDLVKDLESGKVYKVKRVELTPVQGIPPRIYTEQIVE
jgi:hypothetical protein